ncbi:MAG: hypothetical protein ACRD2E_09685 [Terriglobales bacterium]
MSPASQPGRRAPKPAPFAAAGPPDRSGGGRGAWYAVASLPVILSAAAVIRIVAAWEYTRHFSHHALGVLPFLFEPGNIAYALVSGQGFASPLRVPSGPTAWVAPLYPGLLAALFHLFGVYTFGAFVAAVALNIALVTLACWPLYALGRRVGGVRVAAVAAWLWALYPNAILLTYESMWGDCLSALLAITALWAVVALTDAKAVSWGHGAAYGLLWGAILLTNPTLAVLLPLWLGWSLWRRRSRAVGPARWRGPAIALAVAILTAVPWTVRNYRALHAWIPVRSDLGLALWLGNNPRAPFLWRGQQHPIDDAQQRAMFLRQGEVAYMHRKLRLAVSYMAGHPAREAALTWYRFLAFWSGGSPFPLRSLRGFRSAWDRYVLLFDLLAGLAALGGMVRLFRRGSPYAFPLAVVPLVVPWAYYLTLAVPRYRLPVDPAVLLFAALCFSQQLGDALSASGRPLPAIGAQSQRPAGASRTGRLSRSLPAASPPGQVGRSEK